jgi:hypothetical protein
LAGMTISQNISIALFGCGLAFWAWLSTQPKGTMAGEIRITEPSTLDLKTPSVLESY